MMSKPNSRRGPETNVSIETQRLIKGMMKSSKLSYAQQKVLDSCLHSPDFGLPKLGGNYESKKSSAAAAPASRKLTSLRPSRKPLSHIVAEGAYEPEPFHPKFTKDMSVEKERLRDLREFPDRVVEKDSFVAQIKAREEALRVEDEIERRKAELEGGVDEFSELLKEIYERKEWLDGMIEMGKGDAYRLRIQVEINQRISRLEALQKKRRKAESRINTVDDVRTQMQKMEM